MQKLKMTMNLDKQNRAKEQLITPDQTIEAKVAAQFAKYKEEERAKKELEEKTRKEIEEKTRKDIEEKTRKEMEEKAKEEKSKVAKLVEDAKRQREKAIELAKEKENDETPACPTCHSHVHKTVTNGTRVKCVGPNCPKEFELVDMTSDLQCIGCGAPLKHDNLKNKDDGCPFCHGKKARKFDWSKVWKVPKQTENTGDIRSGIGQIGLVNLGK